MFFFFINSNIYLNVSHLPGGPWRPTFLQAVLHFLHYIGLLLKTKSSVIKEVSSNQTYELTIKLWRESDNDTYNKNSVQVVTGDGIVDTQLQGNVAVDSAFSSRVLLQELHRYFCL